MRITKYDRIASLGGGAVLLTAELLLVQGIDGFTWTLVTAFWVLNVVHFVTWGFGLGRLLELWHAARKFRKTIPESMTRDYR